MYIGRIDCTAVLRSICEGITSVLTLIFIKNCERRSGAWERTNWIDLGRQSRSRQTRSLFTMRNNTFRREAALRQAC
jgi:hypothetical protein